MLTGRFKSSFSQARATAALAGGGEPGRARGLRCVDGFLPTLTTWREASTNYVRQRQRSGFVEGLNNTLKVLKRRCDGLDSVQTLFQRLRLDWEGYRWFGIG